MHAHLHTAARVIAAGDSSMSSADARVDALSRLARGCARKGHAIAFDLLGDASEAEDAVQESLARACEQWESLRDPGALEGWFYRVLTNLCMRTLRRRRLYHGIRRLIYGGRTVRRGGEDEGDEAAASEVDVVDDAAGADEQLVRAGDVVRTLDAVGALPVMQRTALVLRYGHDLGVPEVAAAMGVSVGTVKTHLVRGLARVRGAVGER